MKKLVILFGCMLIFSACEEKKNEDIPALSEIKSGRVTGVVFDKVTGNPKTGVKVAIKGNITRTSSYGSANCNVNVTAASFVTGNDGAYMFDKVTPSSLQFKCGEGSMSIDITYVVYIDNGKTSYTNQQTVTVNEGQTTNADFND